MKIKELYQFCKNHDIKIKYDDLSLSVMRKLHHQTIFKPVIVMKDLVFKRYKQDYESFLMNTHLYERYRDKTLVLHYNFNILGVILKEYLEGAYKNLHVNSISYISPKKLHRFQPSPIKDKNGNYIINISLKNNVDVEYLLELAKQESRDIYINIYSTNVFEKDYDLLLNFCPEFIEEFDIERLKVFWAVSTLNHTEYDLLQYKKTTSYKKIDFKYVKENEKFNILESLAFKRMIPYNSKYIFENTETYDYNSGDYYVYEKH